jgi:hypothetical protein
MQGKDLQQKGYKTLLTILLIMICTAFTGCSSNDRGIKNPQPSVYYWRTSFKLDKAERRFIKRHNIRKIYLRYFDVVYDEKQGVIPTATLTFDDNIPQHVEIIPTVFIDEKCLHYNMEGISRKLVDRICQMSETNDVKNVREMQIDCDWTQHSMKKYFDFLAQTRQLLKSKGMNLSVTIRLHQLAMPAPPSDYGVLMIYNTGDCRKYGCKNPILDINDVKPYIKYLKEYPLPLCAAYPNFSWQLLFKGKSFKSILHDEKLDDPTVYNRVRENAYEVVSSRQLPSYIGSDTYSVYIDAGDSVFTYSCTADEIIQVKNMLGKTRRSLNRQIVIYNLDSKNITRYNDDEYEKIYNR